MKKNIRIEKSRIKYLTFQLYSVYSIFFITLNITRPILFCVKYSKFRRREKKEEANSLNGPIYLHKRYRLLLNYPMPMSLSRIRELRHSNLLTHIEKIKQKEEQEKKQSGENKDVFSFYF